MIPIPALVLPGVLPERFTLPAPEFMILAPKFIPIELAPAPLEVPVIVSVPLLILIVPARTPIAESAAFNAVPEIIIFPEPVADIGEPLVKQTPVATLPVEFAVPLIVN